MIHCWRGVLVHTIFVLTQPTYLAVRYFLNPSYFNLGSAPWLTITAITWIYIVTQISIPFFTSPLRHLPSPPGKRFPLGNMDFNGGRPPTDNVAQMLRNTPNDGILALWGPFYLFCQIIPTGTDALMDMLNTHNYDWEKHPTDRKFLARTLGEGLVSVEGNKHKSMRRVVAPAFSGRHIRDLVPLFYAKGLSFADSLAREVQSSPGGSLEMMAQMSRVTLDIIGAAGVGKDFNTINNDEDPLAKLYATITSTDRGPLLLYVLIQFFVPQWIVRNLRGTVYARVAAAQAQLRKDVRALMQEKKQMMLEKSEQQKDIVAIIMRSGDFSDDYLVDQLLTFLAAGHDTTASALTWTTWLLSLHPEMQDRLRAECNAHLANKSESEINASIFDAETMPFLTAVCNETLRLYPTVPVTARHAVKPTKIGNQYIPKGTMSLVSLWGINRDHTLWGDDADEYNPNRWLEGPYAATGGAKSPYSLLTFLHGPRSCIGQNFARTEMKCLLAVLIMRFRFEVADPDKKVEIGGLVTIKPQGGLRLKLHDLKADAEERADSKV